MHRVGFYFIKLGIKIMSKKNRDEPKEIIFSRHHILPTSQGWANKDENIVVIRDVQHRSIHNLFNNKMIAEQLLTAIDISAKALRPDVVNRLIETLNSRDINNPNERYRHECIE